MCLASEIETAQQENDFFSSSFLFQPMVNLELSILSVGKSNFNETETDTSAKKVLIQRK